MIVRELHDGSFLIHGILFSELEDLLSAYEASPFSWNEDDSVLYSDTDPMRPIREALRKYTGRTQEQLAYNVQKSTE